MIPDNEFKNKASQYFAYFNQGEIWVGAEGHVRIKQDMDYRWRVNAANYMIKFAFNYQMYYAFGEIYRMSEPIYAEHTFEREADVLVPVSKQFSELDLMGDSALDGYEESQDWAADHPKEWMRTTTLYRSMIGGLPQDALELLI